MNKIGLPGLLTQLQQDAQNVVRAEIQLAKSKATAKVMALRSGMILLVAAVIIALASIGGLVTGLVIALAPIVGGVLAGVIVLAGGWLIAGLLGWIGARLFSGENTPADAEKA